MSSQYSYIPLSSVDDYDYVGYQGNDVASMGIIDVTHDLSPVMTEKLENYAHKIFKSPKYWPKKLHKDLDKINYWPIENGQMTDLIGDANMIQGVSTNFVLDRHGNASSALNLNGGYTYLYNNVYINTLVLS
jgi:hypothetical protein